MQIQAPTASTEQFGLKTILSDGTVAILLMMRWKLIRSIQGEAVYRTVMNLLRQIDYLTAKITRGVEPPQMIGITCLTIEGRKKYTLSSPH